VHHRLERLTAPGPEVRADGVGDRDQRDLHDLVVGDAEDLRGLAAIAARLASIATGDRSSGGRVTIGWIDVAPGGWLRTNPT